MARGKHGFSILSESLSPDDAIPSRKQSFEHQTDFIGRGRRLRSHGSIWEADVPFVISEPLTDQYAERGHAGGLRSHEIFDFAINGPA